MTTYFVSQSSGVPCCESVLCVFHVAVHVFRVVVQVARLLFHYVCDGLHVLFHDS